MKVTNRKPWRYRATGDLGHITQSRRKMIAELRGQGEKIGRIAELVALDERAVCRHIRRLRLSGDERATSLPPGRPRSANA